MKYIKFSDCLKLVLSNLGISSNRLSKAINVDSSLVNRWINGKRIPSYNTAYIEQIAEFIAKNIYNTYQKQKISNLITEVCGSNDNSLPIKDQIQHMLSEAQGYSIECYQLELKEHKLTGKKTHYLYAEETTSLSNSTSLSPKDKILFGSKSLLQASLHLLEEATRKKPRNDDTIYIVFYDFSRSICTDTDRKNYVNLLIKVLEIGWNLILYIKPMYDTEYYIDFINFLKPLMPNYRIQLYYVKRYDSCVMGEKLLLIPNVGALICFRNELQTTTSNAFYFTNPAAISIHLSHIRELMARNSEPLLERYQSSLHFYNNLVKFEKAGHDRFAYRYSFDMTIYPKELYIKLLGKSNLTSEEKERSIDQYVKRQEAFLYNLQRQQCWDIYDVACMKDLIQDNQISFYNYNSVVPMIAEVDDIISLLKNIIHLLETYANYHIAFMKNHQDNCIDTKNIYCLVKERHSVLFELISLENDMPETRIVSEESMFVNGFYEYFKNIWEQIAPIYKNKLDIIHWLEKEIEFLLKCRSTLNDAQSMQKEVYIPHRFTATPHSEMI